MGRAFSLPLRGHPTTLPPRIPCWAVILRLNSVAGFAEPALSPSIGQARTATLAGVFQRRVPRRRPASQGTAYLRVSLVSLRLGDLAGHSLDCPHTRRQTGWGPSPTTHHATDRALCDPFTLLGVRVRYPGAIPAYQTCHSTSCQPFPASPRRPEAVSGRRDLLQHQPRAALWEGGVRRRGATRPVAPPTPSSALGRWSAQILLQL
jgi:hypothetical protein